MLHLMFGLDRRSLSLMRVAFGIVLLRDVYVNYPHAEALYSDRGFWPIHVATEMQDPSSWSLHFANPTLAYQQWLLVLQAIFAAVYLVGYHTRLMGILSWMMLCSIHTRNGIVLNGGDSMLRCVLFWCMFMPMGDYLSIDAVLKTFRRSNRASSTTSSTSSSNSSDATSTSGVPSTSFDGSSSSSSSGSASTTIGSEGTSQPSKELIEQHERHMMHVSVASVAFVLQIAYVYIWSYGLKIGPQWDDGSATYYALHSDMFATPLAIWLRENFPLDLLASATLGVLYFELVGPFLWFCPFYPQASRLVGIVLFCMMHIGFGSCLIIGLFMWIPCCCQLAFLPPLFWDWLLPTPELATSTTSSGTTKKPSRWRWFDPEIIIYVDSASAASLHVRWVLAFCKTFLLVPATLVMSADAACIEELNARASSIAVASYSQSDAATKHNKDSALPTMPSIATIAFSSWPENGSHDGVAGARSIALGSDASLSAKRHYGTGAVWMIARASPLIGRPIASLLARWPLRFIAEPIMDGVFRLGSHVHSVRHLSTQSNAGPKRSTGFESMVASLAFATVQLFANLSLPSSAATEAPPISWLSLLVGLLVAGVTPSGSPSAILPLAPVPRARGQRGKPKRTVRRVAAFVVQGVLVFLIVYVIMWNLASHFHTPEIVPSSMRWIAFVTRLDQWWGMFSPNAPWVSGWFVVPGILNDGSVIDIWTAKPVTFEKPALVSRTFPNQRWRKYMMSLWELEHLDKVRLRE